MADESEADEEPPAEGGAEEAPGEGKAPDETEDRPGEQQDDAEGEGPAEREQESPPESEASEQAQGEGSEADEPPPGEAPGSRRPGKADMSLSENAAEQGQAEAVDRFDQFGQQPMMDVPDEAGAGEVPALGGRRAMGPGMAVIEQRLRQVEGDPTLLIGNQFKLEEMRMMQGGRGPMREVRPW